MFACEKPTAMYPNGRTGTRAGYEADRKARQGICSACASAQRSATSARNSSAKKQQTANVMSFLNELADDTKSRMEGHRPSKLWWEKAACRNEPKALFFGFGDDLKKGAEICKRCPVRLDCAVANSDEDFGMWGGVSRLTSHACATPSSKYPEGRTGTVAGVNAHAHAGEPPCESCLEARRVERASA